MKNSIPFLVALSLGIYAERLHLDAVKAGPLYCNSFSRDSQCKSRKEATRKSQYNFADPSAIKNTSISQIFDPVKILSPLLPGQEAESTDIMPGKSGHNGSSSQSNAKPGEDEADSLNLIPLNNGDTSNLQENKDFFWDTPTEFTSPGPPVNRPSPRPPEPPKNNSPKPYVILVNGYQDQLIWKYPQDSENAFVSYIPIVTNYLARMGSTFRLVPWDHFEDGGGQKSRKVLGVTCGRTLTCGNDAEFLRDGANFINTNVPLNRPLVLIGHSFGADSLIKLSFRINRRIAFLGLIDSTSTVGLRTKNVVIPDHVHYFFNRWQENPLSPDNIVPFDSRITSGRLYCTKPSTCDQDVQNISRSSSGAPLEIACKFYEITCNGYKVYFWGVDYGKKQQRIEHNSMPSDKFIQARMLESIKKALGTFKPPRG